MADRFDEPDNLVQSSFVIPCATIGKGKGRITSEDEDDLFTILTEYEKDESGAKWRKTGYESSVKHLRSSFKKCEKLLYQPLLDRIDDVIRKQEEPAQFYLPGPSRLTTLALFGVPLYDRIAEFVRDSLQEKNSNTRWVYLHPRECLDLATTLRILTARAFDSNCTEPNPDKYDLSDPMSLLALGDGEAFNRICIFIDNLAFFHLGILNDLLQAIHSISQTKGAPRFTIFLSSQLGQMTLDDKLDPNTLPILDICIFDLPSPTLGFEKVIEELYINSSKESLCPIWMGDKVFDLVRRQYYESSPNLNRVQSTLELALHHHFSQNPLSAIADSKETFQTSAWKSTFFARLRDAILQECWHSDETQKTVRLPLPGLDSSSSRPASKQEHLRLLLEDDQYLINGINDLFLAVRKSQSSVVSGIRLVHLLREILEMNGKDSNMANTHDQKLLFEPRKQTIGGLLFALSNKQQIRSTLQDLRISIRSRSMNDLETLLERVRESGILSTSTHAEAFESLFKQMKGVSENADLETPEKGDQAKSNENVTSHKNTVNDDEIKRLEEVQRNLLREESSSALKREAGDWILNTVRSLLNSSVPLQEQVWTYNLTGYLISIIDPSPRVNILAALSDPKSYLSTNDNLPDVCRAYRTYQDAGRMINLADWFNAFRSSIKDGDNKKQHKRKRSNSSDLSSVESDSSPFVVKEQISENVRKEIGKWNQAETIQLRFALAVHEMAKMGFLKRTGRKAEHVLKLIHDLPPQKS